MESSPKLLFCRNQDKKKKAVEKAKERKTIVATFEQLSRKNRRGLVEELS